MNVERKGNTLVITVTLEKPYRSKSAIAKALEKGQNPENVPANMVYTSGGFIRSGDVKLSLNVLQA